MPMVDVKDFNKHELDKHIANLLQSYYQRLANGLDISPAERFRLEGYLQAVVECGLLESERLESITSKLQQQFAGSANTQTIMKLTPNTSLESWHLAFQMHRAPVTPSS